MTNIRHFLAFVLLLGAATLNAQNTNPASVEMADGFRSSGKIYVVIAVVLIILTGLLVYVISLDRKISRIEKEQKK
jgi:CcmD family protein